MKLAIALLAGIAAYQFTGRYFDTVMAFIVTLCACDYLVRRREQKNPNL